MKKDRLDKLLVDRGLAETRQKAQAMIMAGLVFHGQERMDKPGRLIPVDLPLTVEKPLPFVGRGGLKLEEALHVFKLEVADRICADIGSSTGGFTDCLLKRGAAKVFAVDVDIRQLDGRLRADHRVVTLEKNARYLEPGDFAETLSLVVMDVSFISVLKVMPALKRILENEGGVVRSPCIEERCGAPRHDTSTGDTKPVAEFRVVQNQETGITSPILLSLIKPQFEAGRGRIGKKGLVRDPAVHRDVLAQIAGGAADLGFRLHGLMRCSTRGQKGNQEFFGIWTLGGELPAEEAVASWIEAAVRGDDTRPAEP
jgi:23S rRNA (cytidine1920-2'-O)/16S rRNA (cytidine1409-2'-O)-methyltransferase